MVVAAPADPTVVCERKPMTHASTPATGFGFVDEDVCQRVSSYLFSRHVPCFRDLRIEVRRGIVTVRGQLDSDHQRQVALQTCRRVAGVLELVDRIEVTSRQASGSSDNANLRSGTRPR